MTSRTETFFSGLNDTDRTPRPRCPVVERPGPGGVSQGPLRPFFQGRRQRARDEPHPAEIAFPDRRRVGFLPDERPSALRIVPTAGDSLRHVVGRTAVGVLLDRSRGTEVVGDDDHMIVGDAAGRPGVTGLPLSGVHSGPTLQISMVQSSRGSAMQRLGPAAEGRKPYFSTRPPMSLTASRAVAHRSRAKTWACSMVMIWRVGALDVRDVGLGRLGTRALPDRQLPLVHLGIARVEVGIRPSRPGGSPR